MKFPPGDKVEPITKIAESLGLDPDHLIPYGRYKAKISLDALKDPADYRGKLVVVTGIPPTPAGEGKTTTAIGLTQGMGRLGHKVSVNLREPTLGPIFGIKGGGTGGSRSANVGGTAIYQACLEVKERAGAVAAHLLEVLSVSFD